MGVGPGDEVIIPEVTWIATVSAVMYVGATPIFADIEPDTWVMDPKSVERCISKKTKAIIPVHLYGHPVDMEPLWELASKFGVDLLEDAAPSIGAEYKNKKTGSLGKVAAFSFQGAKAIVTGEGGILVSNDKELIEKARFLNDHGRDPHRALYNIAIGYKYKMSNIQAALGLAQIERVEEIIAKKRQLFNWYKERLDDIDEIRLNVERPWARNIFWMSSLILGDSIKISRDEFMKRLKERNIDTRPFFYPISSLPMFNKAKVNNPVAYSIPLRGVNLPSGHERTEEEIDYICAHIKDILGCKLTKISNIQPYGWLSYRDKVHRILREYKNASDGELANYCLPIILSGEILGRLRPLTITTLRKESEIELLANWRKAVQRWFPSQFNVTFDGTKKWFHEQVLQTDDRILFMVENTEGIPVGHVGLFRFDYKKKSCELDNIVRGIPDLFPGAMTIACNSLLSWAFEKLGIETPYLRVTSDNEPALKLYGKLGFKEIQRVPLMNVKEGDVIRWIDIIRNSYYEVQRYFVIMKLLKSDWINPQ